MYMIYDCRASTTFRGPEFNSPGYAPSYGPPPGAPPGSGYVLMQPLTFIILAHVYLYPIHPILLQRSTSHHLLAIPSPTHIGIPKPILPNTSPSPNQPTNNQTATAPHPAHLPSPETATPKEVEEATAVATTKDREGTRPREDRRPCRAFCSLFFVFFFFFGEGGG